MTTALSNPATGTRATGRPVPFGPGLAAAGLVLGAAGNTAQAALGQIIDRPSEVAHQIALANERPVIVTAMCVVGLLAVPFMAVGFLAAARFLRGRAQAIAMARDSGLGGKD